MPSGQACGQGAPSQGHYRQRRGNKYCGPGDGRLSPRGRCRSWQVSMFSRVSLRFESRKMTGQGFSRYPSIADDCHSWDEPGMPALVSSVGATHNLFLACRSDGRIGLWSLEPPRCSPHKNTGLSSKPHHSSHQKLDRSPAKPLLNSVAGRSCHKTGHRGVQVAHTEDSGSPVAPGSRPSALEQPGACRSCHRSGLPLAEAHRRWGSRPVRARVSPGRRESPLLCASLPVPPQGESQPVRSEL